MQELKEDRETPQRRVFISYFHRKFQPKTIKLEITGIENLYIEMNEGKSPVVLKRCE
jgi:hypothetical protein